VTPKPNNPQFYHFSRPLTSSPRFATELLKNTRIQLRKSQSGQEDIISKPGNSRRQVLFH